MADETTPSLGGTELIVGTIKRVAHRNDETGFCILAVVGPDDFAEMTCLCTLPRACPGAAFRARGRWTVHPVYGKQFKATSAVASIPDNPAAFEAYLASEFVDGIGPTLAKRICATFGMDTMRVIREQPERLREVEGIGAKRGQALCGAVKTALAMEALMVFLFQHGIGESLAFKIYRQYGDRAIELIRENPYRLADEMFGVGFKIADKIARSAGIAATNYFRLRAGFLFALNEAEDAGNTAMWAPDLMKSAGALLAVEGEHIEAYLPEAFEKLRSEASETTFDTIRVTDSVEGLIVQLARTAMHEESIGLELERLLRGPRLFQLAYPDVLAAQAAKEASAELDASQQAAVELILRNKVSILTGGPGTGKTYCLNIALRAFAKLNLRIKLAAPTGKAARRMREATGRDASTIHRLLGTAPGGMFVRSRSNPLEVDVLVIDETSMLDTRLTAALLSAIPNHTVVLFVGDVNQLPSVQPGAILTDMIESGAVPVATLAKIHRQAEGSAIVWNAHKVNEGHSKELRLGEDFAFTATGSAEETAEVLLRQTLDAMREHGVFNVQVITAGHKGPVGTVELNKRLQAALNGTPSAAITFGATRFGLGDRVIVTKNKYDPATKELLAANGTIGIITKVAESGLDIETDDGDVVEFAKCDLDELALAYALTVHKMQGSDFPVVVMPIHNTHFKILSRPWLYTGITRAKLKLILVGQRQALAVAIKNVETRARLTVLPIYLNEGKARAAVRAQATARA